MATHITPRLPVSPPSSPMRPETAKCTIRAIPPSPSPSTSPLSQTEASGLNYADTGAPTANEEGGDTSSDSEVEYPDTPTPMTTWQKRSAYLDLGTPTPPSVTNSKGPSKPRSKASSSSLRQGAAPVPLLPVRPMHPMQETTQDEAYKQRKELEHDIVQFNNESRAQGIATELQRFKRSGEDAAVVTKNAYKLQPRHPDHPPIQITRRPLPPPGRVPPPIPPPQPRRVPPPVPARAAHPAVDICGRMPYHTSIENQAHAYAAGQGHRPFFSRASATSNATIASHQAVFNTPGRDEFERKKITLEADEGPFAHAISMRDLNQSRRVINDEVEARAPAKDWKEEMMCGCVAM
ncbi:hypothetical protein PTT_18279 [Pyrenophora teres f. teres 0-1]|uniref:Uncharacterized protein n=1 Tax=Pyrenophora teres f. teres (strain 0-1) TaxID=861557 RepID=E3S6D4_PYRTT|nr:hypothetical protein PTT_18279 [Pyrenophora teres f. teres 0-1]